MLNLAVSLKKEHFDTGNKPLFKGKVLGMIFQKPSLRTRVSFDMAMRHMGGDALNLSPSEIGLGKRESIADVARVLSGYVSILMARVFEHDHVVQLAQWADISVINGLSDYNHPCQIMADMYTIKEHKRRHTDLKVTYIGDGNNIANSWINLAAKLPFHLVICSPSGYEPDKETLAYAHKKNISEIEMISDPERAVKKADVIYTDVWASMGQEQEAETRHKIFMPYQVNSNLMKSADKDALVMHCLPAHRGDEITDEVIDGPGSIVFDEAENRMHVQKAIIVKLMQNVQNR